MADPSKRVDVADRTATCIECGTTIPVGKSGPLPQRCHPCKKARLNARLREQRETDPEYREREYAKHRKWARDNREQLREQERDYWRQNRDKKRAKDRRYYQRHRDKVRAANDAWLEANADRYEAWRRRYYRENREWFREAGAQNYEQAKADYIRRAAERRARKLAATVERVERDVVWSRDGGICYLCEEPADPDDWHLEHVVPLIAGGEHSYANTAVSHPECNRAKGARVL